MHFSWISSAEGEKFAATARKVTQAIQAAGPANYMVKAPLEEVA